MRWNNSTSALLMLTFLGCPAVAQTAALNPPIHQQKYIMGTVFEIVAYETHDRPAAVAIDEAFREIVRLDGVLSNYNPDSELSLLNRNAHFHPQRVSTDLYRVIEQSFEYSHLSSGEFDISVGPLVDLWKVQLRGEGVVTAAAEKKARECVGFKNIELLPPNRIEFRSSCLRVDVGSIGKGYAVDRAAKVLRAQGVESALINAGGSTVYAIGAPPGDSGWTIQLRDPSGKVRPEVLLKDNSVSTSEQTAPSLLGQNPGGHIIDPQNGKPLKSSGAVSVVAKTATASDALSTTLLLVGPERGKVLLSGLPETAAVWVSPDGHAETVFNGAAISISHKVSGRTYLERSSTR